MKSFFPVRGNQCDANFSGSLQPPTSDAIWETQAWTCLSYAAFAAPLAALVHTGQKWDLVH